MDKKEFLETKLPVVEIFNSISGEGISAGEIFSFVRIAGCNLRCTYCDTTYSYNELNESNEMLFPEEIAARLKKIGCRKILCTGGEPLELGKAKRYLPLFLSSKGFDVRIESNGSCPGYTKEEINNYIDNNEDFVLNYVLDVKCPSSGMSNNNLYDENFRLLNSRDELKFVVGNQEDIEFSLKIVEKYKSILSSKKVTINYSPIFNMCEPKELVEILKKHNEYFQGNNLMLRLSLQIHKFIWPVDKRGV